MEIVFMVAAGVFGLALGIASLTYAIFLVAIRRHPSRFFSRVCRAHPVACVLRGLVTSFLSQAWAVISYPLGPCLGWASRRRPGSGETVVVCLHGIYHNPSAFLFLRPALRRAGCRHVLAPGYSSFAGDFDAVAGRVLDSLRRAVPADCPLVLIGHSLGGLLVRQLAAAPDVADRVRAVVTLGTPHGGSRLAVLALGELGRSLVPASPLFVRLAAVPDPPRAALTALVSPVDNMVVPPTGLEIHRPAWRLELTAPMSHVAMLYHPAVIRRVTELVRAAVRAG